MICGKDNAILTSSSCSVVEECNLLWFGATEILNLTAMNVHHMSVSVINHLKKLFAELLCQKNAGSNNNNSRTVINILLILNNIMYHTHSLTTTRRDDNLTLVICQHRIQCLVLVGAKGDQMLSCPV